MTERILIIDDERSIRSTLREILEYEKFAISEAEDGAKGLELLEKQKPSLILCDIKMARMDGMEVLAKIMETHADIPVIMISGHGNIETAVEAIRKGAYDFIEKPIDLNRLLVSVRNALDRSNLIEENKTLRKKIQAKTTTEIIGQSASIQEVLTIIDKVAPTDARVLITGSNGTGKELVAKQLHEKSARTKAPFVEVNCAAIPAELIESELFGHEKGAFTSAIKQRKGKFEQAEGGTLFLDEIGDMSLSAQAKVLRALQENRINRVGGDKDIPVNVRVVAATNKDLQAAIADGKFREDLYHRLGVILVQVPALSDRKDDIPLLVEYFLDKICNEQGIARKKIQAAAVKALQTHPWTGNIRELRNVVERLVILSEKDITQADVQRYALM